MNDRKSRMVANERAERINAEQLLIGNGLHQPSFRKFTKNTFDGQS